MQKNIAITVLVAAFAMIIGHSIGNSAASPTSPVIMKNVALTNQRGVIPFTTLFTPSKTGLFRISAYMTATAPTQATNAPYSLTLSWADDAGQETGGLVNILYPYATPPKAFGISPGGDFLAGGVSVIEAVAGQPVQFSVASFKPLDEGSYSVYFTVERLN